MEALFEWVKLDAKEQVFHFELCDFNELTRNIVAEWVPTLERNHFEYDFDIPEDEYFFVLTLIPIPAFLIICFKMCLCTVAAIN